MTEIAVVGAGMIGAALADRLTSAGARVTVLDGRDPGSGTSGTSLAWINSHNKPPRSYHDFSVQGMEEWRRLAGTVASAPWYVPTGSIRWAESAEARADLDACIARLRSWDYPAAVLTRRQLAALEPHVRLPSGADVGYFAAEGFVHGRQAVEYLMARATARGADVITGSAVAALERDGDVLTGARLLGGGQVTADLYVLCAGAATPRLLGGVGVTVPLVPGDAPGSAAPCLVGHVATGPDLVQRVIQSPELSVRPLAPSGLYLEAGDVNSTVDAGTGSRAIGEHIATLVRRAKAILPTVDGNAPAGGRICVRPLPADGKPIVGRIPGLANAYLVVTHSGMTLGPLLGRLAAAEILGSQQHELDPYRITRF